MSPKDSFTRVGNGIGKRPGSGENDSACHTSAPAEAGPQVRCRWREGRDDGRTGTWSAGYAGGRELSNAPLIATELWLFRTGTAEADRPLPACGGER